MKKALVICGLVVAMLLLALVACSGQAEEPPTPSAAQAQPAETPEPQETSPQAEPMSIARRLPTQEELELLFEKAYDWGNLLRDDIFEMTEDDLIEFELQDLEESFALNPDLIKPVDITEQYISWRLEAHPAETQAVPPIDVGTNVAGGNTGGTAQQQTPPSTNTATGETTQQQQQPQQEQQPVSPEDQQWNNDFGIKDTSQFRTSEEMGYTPILPGEIIYGK